MTESRKTQLFDTESSADDGAEHENYGDKVKSFKNQCGAKMEYDMKYAGALANICNMGVDPTHHLQQQPEKKSRKTQLFDTESSADDGAEHENYGDKVDARDIPLLYLETKIQNAPVGSPQRQEAQKNLLEEINHRKQIDQNIIEILRLSLKQTDVLDLLTSTRTTGQPVVDDWDCYKTLVKSFKNQCGAKMEYDMKYAGALANICNMGVDVKQKIFYINELYTMVFKNINSKRKKNSYLEDLLRQCLFLFLFFLMLCFFSQQNLAKPNYFIQNLALMMVQNTKTTGIRSMRGEISLCYISRRSPDLSRLKHKRKMCLFLMFHYIFISQIQNAPVGSPQRQEAQKNLLEEINHRKQIDQKIIEILRLSLKQTDVLDLLTSTRTTGQPVVDDWDCYWTLVKSFKNQCGAKMEYDMKYAGALANICNMGVDVKKSVAAIEEACAH
ncbi:LOW QUALITY PROTEIN: hypothetical protein HID58_043614 [Brassica napus]|uniref:Legumain prodomain domain-containing protein n=2 Tax=Brassica napus TaxID=3708 RepID=A0ABQ8BH04_BRANA|nr:LOW QUALITY PROTEIN: hypothetical protein HID58_043614 [Brassica napus]